MKNNILNLIFISYKLISASGVGVTSGVTCF